MTSLAYGHITKRAEHEIRGAMQQVAARKIGTYSLGRTVGDGRGELALWDALVATLDASAIADTRAGRAGFEAPAYAKRAPGAL